MTFSLRWSTAWAMVLGGAGCLHFAALADEAEYYDGSQPESVISPVENVTPGGKRTKARAPSEPETLSPSDTPISDLPPIYPSVDGAPNMPTYQFHSYGEAMGQSITNCPEYTSEYVGAEASDWLCPRALCCGGRWSVLGEVTYLRYHRADGLRVGDDAAGEDVDPGSFQASPRLTLGYTFANGLGIRTRWWDFHLSQTPNEGAPSALTVDTYNVDVELFEQFPLNECWDVELSGGLRYNTFSETLNDLVGENETRFNTFDGLGILGGAEVRRSLSSGALYGRARGALLVDDITRFNAGSGTTRVFDSTVGMAEFGLGYELALPFINGSQLVGRFGGEYQNWYNFSSNFTAGAADPEDFWTGSSDVGFAGLVFSLGWMR